MAKPTPATALATQPVDTTNDELAALSGVDFDALPDGLGEVDRDDVRIPALVINMKGTAANGRKIPEDEYYDTVAETTRPTVNAALLTFHKTNLYSFFDQGLGKTQRVCSSYDRVTGTMHETGVQRKCEGCPDAQWRAGEKGRTRNCGPVWNVFGLDRDTKQPFVLRCKRTALGPIKQYLQRHHIGKRYAAGKYSNVPLYVFQCAMSVRMHESGKYALPVFTRGPVLTSAEVHENAAHVLALRDLIMPALAKAEAADQSDDGGGYEGSGAANDNAGPGPDTSFEPDKYTGGQGQNFTDS